MTTLLVACGSDGSVQLSPPISTAKPIATNRIAFSWNGAVGGGTAATAIGRDPLRRILNTLTGNNPVTVGAPQNVNDPYDIAFRSGLADATISATEVDLNGITVSTAAHYVAKDQTIVVSTPAPTANGIITVIGQSFGTSAVNISFPDGTAGSATTNVAQVLAPSCPQNASGFNLPTAYRYDATSKLVVATTTLANADLYLTGPACTGDFANTATATVVNAPNGYATQSINTPFGSIVSALPFIPVGTTISMSPSFGNPFLIVKTFSAGVYIKFRITSFSCNGSFCERSTDFEGDAVASDASSNFLI